MRENRPTHKAGIDTSADFASPFIRDEAIWTEHSTLHSFARIRFARFRARCMWFESVAVATATGVVERLTLVAGHVEEPPQLTRRTQTGLHSQWAMRL